MWLPAVAAVHPWNSARRAQRSRMGAMATVVNGLDELKAKVGDHLGYSAWHTVSQEQVNLFADATGDHQWIHVDLERAKAGPFGGPIAHGYLTLSLTLLMARELDGIKIDLDPKMSVNYGLNRVRFVSPVHVGKRIRLRS